MDLAEARAAVAAVKASGPNPTGQRALEAMVDRLLDILEAKDPSDIRIPDPAALPGQSSHMTFDYYQELASRMAVYDDSRGAPIIYVTGKLACEGAEAHQVVLKKHYHDTPADGAEADRKLKKELGDALWYLSESCKVKGWRFSEVAADNLDKISGRSERGTLAGSGDDR